MSKGAQKEEQGVNNTSNTSFSIPIEANGTTQLPQMMPSQESPSVADAEAIINATIPSGRPLDHSESETSLGSSRKSSVVYTDRGTRRGHIASLLGMSLTDPSLLYQGPSVTIPRTHYYASVHATYGGFLAWKHLNERSGAVLPSLPDRLKNCDFEFTYQSLDTMFMPQHAVRQLMKVTDIRNDNEDDTSSANATTTFTTWANTTTTTSSTSSTRQLQQQSPFAIVGSFMSGVTTQLATLATGLALPQISSVSPSAFLDQMPYFARTFTTDAAHAKAALLYLHNTLGVKHVVFMVIDDPCCDPYSPQVQQLAQKLDMTILRILFTQDTLGKAMQQLKESGYRYVFLLPIGLQPILEAAVQYNVIGNPQYTWFIAERSILTEASFSLDGDTDYSIAQALNGIGVVNLNAPDSPAFEAAMLEMTTNTTLQQEFVATQSEPELFDGTFNFSIPHAPHIYQKLTYDAVIALGIAACETPGLFTGPEFYHTLVRTNFEGVSSPPQGAVTFDHTTGTRSSDTAQFIVQNLLLSDEQSDETKIRFESRTAAHVVGGNVSVENPFQFYDNTTTPPLQLPPIVGMDHNLIPLGIQIFGCLMAAVVCLLSLFFLGWTLAYRKTTVVQTAQPAFLAQLCIGCFIMSLTVFPLAMQSGESTPRMDAACVAVDWLVHIGFTIAVSALLAKTWRVNALVKSGVRMRRIQLRPQDVMLPFLMLMAINAGILSAWTILSPKRYKRFPMNDYDMYGRTTQFYGACRSDDHEVERICWILLVVTNAFAVAVACRQCYKARDLPIAFSETKYLAYSMSFLLEALVVGTPSLRAARDDPSARFLIASILICILCLSMLLPVFLYKYQNRNHNQLSFRRSASNLHPMMEGRNSSPYNVTPPDGSADGDDAFIPGVMKILRR